MKASFMLIYLVFILLFVSQVGIQAGANVIITEIMYNPKGSDENQEWLEVKNLGDPINFSEFYFYEADSNHRIKFKKGSEILLKNQHAVICKDWSTFLVNYPNFNGNLFDSSWSYLKNSGELLGIKDSSKNLITYLEYTNIAQEGQSICNTKEELVTCIPTPGIENFPDEIPEKESEKEPEVTSDAPAVSSEVTPPNKNEKTVQGKDTNLLESNLCDFQVQIKSPEVVESGAEFQYFIEFSNLNCKTKKQSFEAYITIEDFFGNVISNERIYKRILCSETVTYSKKLNITEKLFAYRIRSAVVSSNCSEQNLENNFASETLVIRNTASRLESISNSVSPERENLLDLEERTSFLEQGPEISISGNFLKQNLSKLVNFFKRIFHMR